MLEVTADMRDEFFEKNGYMGTDDDVLAWHKREIEKNSEPETKTMKELYESEPDKWVVYYTRENLNNEWDKTPRDFDFEKFNTYKLIAKKDEIVADAVIANPDVEVEFDFEDNDWQIFTEFFDYYQPHHKYRLVRPTSANNAQVEELTYEEAKKPIHGIGEEDENDRTCSNLDNNKHTNDSGNNISMGETISIKDDNGKEYLFEKPEFECELLKVTKDGFILGYIRDDIGLAPIPMSWSDVTGFCYSDCESEIGYNLTPIKAKWYEDESNFPALLVTNSGSDEFFLETFPLNEGTKILLETKKLGLATKEEINSLYYQDKE